MIARDLRLSDESKSSLLRLVDYLTDDQGVACRVGHVEITNCESDDPQWAALEMIAVQNQNVRAKGDKTYHLMLSFHEYPSEKVLRQIEEEFCRELGFKDHQRISVFHNDTDNPHLHIAINKIHPEKLTMREPYYDHTKLAVLCDCMERLHGLVHDNHIPHAQAVETGAKNMEQAGDLESLIGKIQRTCLEDMKKVQSWKEMHHLLGKQGLEMRIRGNGLIISAGDIHVKASSVDRSFSKKRLEERLGTFEAARGVASEPDYTVKPLPRKDFDSSALWGEYQQWTEDNDRARKKALRQARGQRDAELEKTRKTSDLRASIIRHYVSGTALKRVLYALNKRRLRKKAASIKAGYKQQQNDIYQKHRHLTWNAWLTNQAAQGNANAMNALRSRKPSDRVVTNTIASANASRQASAPRKTPVKVTGQGTYIFAKGTKLTARQVRLAPDASEASIREGLEVAAQCFGSSLKVDGSEDFKTQVARIAAQYKVSVRFADQGMEAPRQQLLAREHQQKNRRSR